jgi:hypothetical protein
MKCDKKQRIEMLLPIAIFTFYLQFFDLFPLYPDT